MNLKASVAAAAAILVALTSPSRAALIDGFEFPVMSVISSGPQQESTNSVFGADAIGGHRLLGTQAAGGVGESRLTVTSSGELLFTTTNCVDCRGRVVWYGGGSDGLASVNLLGGNNAFALQLLQLTEAVSLEISVTDELLHTAVLSKVVNVFNDVSQTLYFKYDDFFNLDTVATRFDQVDSISLRVRTGGAQSSPSNALMRVAALETAFVAATPPPPPPTHQVPLPGSLLLAMTALAAARIGTAQRANRQLLAGSASSRT